MAKLRMGIGGSASNPPHLGHKVLIENLLQSNLFEEIHWIPSGVRPDKEGFVAAEHRVAMTQMTFPGEWSEKQKTKFKINLDDVYGGNTPTIEVMEKYIKEFPEAEITWFTGVDLVVPQDKFGGKCEIQATWKRGEELYNNYNFLVLPRPGFVDPKQLNLPTNFAIFEVPTLDISSSEIRRRVEKGESIEGMVTKEVEEYIRENNLYLKI
jgi:nicotinate-nucleotide adenylyltransferase